MNPAKPPLTCRHDGVVKELKITGQGLAQAVARRCRLAWLARAPGRPPFDAAGNRMTPCSLCAQSPAQSEQWYCGFCRSAPTISMLRSLRMSPTCRRSTLIRSAAFGRYCYAYVIAAHLDHEADFQSRLRGACRQRRHRARPLDRRLVELFGEPHLAAGRCVAERCRCTAPTPARG